MLKVTDYVMRIAPLGVFAAMAAVITVQGLGVLADYGKFIGGFYLGLGVLWARADRRRLALVLGGERAAAAQAAARARCCWPSPPRPARPAYPKTMEQLERVRRARAHHRLRAAAGLLVQPRRLDDVPGLRGAVHRPGLTASS